MSDKEIRDERQVLRHLFFFLSRKIMNSKIIVLLNLILKLLVICNKSPS